MMKSNLLNVQVRSLSRFMALLELSDEITVQTQLLKDLVLCLKKQVPTSERFNFFFF